MPRGVQWRIIYTKFGGGDLEVAEQDKAERHKANALGTKIYNLKDKEH
jgi:hypothetical protein